MTQPTGDSEDHLPEDRLPDDHLTGPDGDDGDHDDTWRRVLCTACRAWLTYPESIDSDPLAGPGRLRRRIAVFAHRHLHPDLGVLRPLEVR